MKISLTRELLLASTIVAGLGFTAPAFAQTAAAAPEKAAEVIVVTGTRIARQDLVSNSPLTTVTSETIQETGSLNTEELLNALPQVVPGLTSASNNPSDGTATVDLRGLGASRTLVLVNGRRFVPAQRTSVVDLNSIPAGLIDRVEVVTGGASAVYGSDALGGVVNFRLKKNFQGIEAAAQYGRSGEGDGEQFTTSLLMGANSDDGKGNVTAFVSWYNRNAVLASKRPWAAANFVGGSATGTARADAQALNPFRAVGGNTITGNAAWRAGGTVAAFQNNLPKDNGPIGVGNGDRYDFNPVNFIYSPAERVNLSFVSQYEINKYAEVYADIFYSDSRNSAQLAPTPMTNLLVPANNPFILASPSATALVNSRPNAAAPLVVRRRMIEVGARVETRDSDLYVGTFGLKGEFGESGFNYDFYVQHGRTEFNVGIQNDVSRSRMTAAVNATSTNDCGAALKAIFPGCVPVNIFGPPGSITKEQADFIRLNFLDTTVYEQNIAAFSVSGDLFNLPAGPVGVAMGIEYREDTLEYKPDAAKASSDIFGFNAERPVNGEYDVVEIFGEAAVPILTDVTFAKSLSLDLGVRYSNYSTVGVLTTYKAGGEWEPVDGLRFRGMFQAASRAPNVFELFQQGDQGFPAVVDPCATVLLNGTTRTLSAKTAAFCQTQLGFNPNTQPGGFVQTNSQIEAFSYGNPQLEEEQSETVTLGLVWQPKFVDGLSVTLDYYDISVENYIGALEGGTNGVIAACFASADLSSSACQSSDLGLPLIFRDGSLELKARVPTVNVSALETAGYDLAVNYRTDLSSLGVSWLDGKFTSNLLISYLDNWTLDEVDYSGEYGSGNISQALPEWRGNLGLGYDFANLGFTWNINFYGDGLNRGGDEDDPETGIVSKVDNTFYHDVQVRYDLNPATQLTLGVKNVFDKEPPLLGFGAVDGNTDPNVFDPIGRFVYGAVRLKF
jgi:iron complex outermembrane receptor protein